MSEARASGSTTKQIEALPRGSTFIWCSPHTGYAKEICAKLGRDDVNVLPIGVLNDPDQLRGLRRSLVDADHALVDHATKAQAATWQEFRKFAHD